MRLHLRNIIAKPSEGKASEDVWCYVLIIILFVLFKIHSSVLWKILVLTSSVDIGSGLYNVWYSRYGIKLHFFKKLLEIALILIHIFGLCNIDTQNLVMYG